MTRYLTAALLVAMVNLVEIPPENWSFGNGEMQYADRARPTVKRVQQPEGLHKYPTFSQMVEVAASRFVFISGQVAVDESGKLVGAGDIVAQTKQVFANLGKAPKAAGLGFENVVKISTFISDLKNRPGYHQARKEIFPEGSLPVSLMVEAKLIDESYLVEVEAVAAA